MRTTVAFLFIFLAIQAPVLAQINAYAVMCGVGSSVRSFAGLPLVADKERAIANALDGIKAKGFTFSKAQTDSIQVGSRFFKDNRFKSIEHYATRDGYWFDLVLAENEDSCRRVFGVLGSNQWYSGFWSTGVAFTFITSHSKANSALTALFRNGSVLFNVGSTLPVPIPENYDDLPEEDQRYNTRRAERVRDIVEEIIQQLVTERDRHRIVFPERALSVDERLQGLIQFWSEVKYNFAFFDKVPNLDWDAKLSEFIPIIREDQSNYEYYRNLQHICALLKDGHTNVYMPSFLNSEISQPPIEFTNIQQTAVVTNVVRSLKDRVKLGSVVSKVDGLPVDQYLREHVFPWISSSTEYILRDRGVRDMLKGKVNTKVSVQFTSPGGEEHNIELTRAGASKDDEWVINEQKQWQMLDVKWLADSIAYVAVNTFGNNSLGEEFGKHIDALRKSKGLILDIRQNGGGSTNNAEAVVNYLTEKPYLTSKWKTREHRAAFKAWGSFDANKSSAELDKLSPEEKTEVLRNIDYYKGNVWYEGAPDTVRPAPGEKINVPIVVLIGHNTASAAEDFLICLDYLKRATFVGEKTFGSTGQPLSFDLPGGGSARVCTKRDTYPDGREFVGYGVSPDVQVEPTVADYLTKRDVVLQKGVEVLKSKMKYH